MTPLPRRLPLSYHFRMDQTGAPLGRFIVLSVALHSLLLALSWPKVAVRAHHDEPFISVSVVAPPAAPAGKPAIAPTPAPKASAAPAPKAARRSKETPARTRPSQAPAIIAKEETSPVLEERAFSMAESPPVPEPRRPVPRQEEPPVPKPVEPKNVVEPKDEMIAEPSPTEIAIERRLPTINELLPPLGWSSAGERNPRDEGPVHLNTGNPQYITYFGSVKRAIEAVWQYPQLALKYGLQGKLLMEFTILSNGELEDARILRSSGSGLLDDEALRAVRTAAPFSPIPPWIGRNRIDIIATFEYHDNRTNYRFSP